MPITMDRSPDNASIEATIELCREACFDGEPDGSGDYGTVCSNRKVIELCESVLALRAALERAEAAAAASQAECVELREALAASPCRYRCKDVDADGLPMTLTKCTRCTALSRTPSTTALRAMLERAIEMAREADYDGHCFNEEQICDRIL